MFDSTLMRYPEQLAARLTALSNKVDKLEKKEEKLERDNG